MPRSDAPRSLPRRARWRPALAVGALVAGLHAAVLGWLPLGVGEGWQGDLTRPALAVRQIFAEAPPPPVPVAPVPAPAPQPEPPPPPAVVAALPPPPAVVAALPPPAADAPPPAASAPLPEPEPPPVPVAQVSAEPVAASAPAASAALPAADGGGLAPPVYATRLPPPALLRYDLRRGGITGSAEWRWGTAGGRYTMTLEGSALSITLLNWTSEGTLDAAGVAPERFVDKRIRRSPQAANFQRATGRITYSGPAVEYPLVAGAQDRLSWMVQLPAIVAADPARFTRPGASIVMFVTGARGDGELWHFEVDGSEAVELPVGRVERALRLHRQPRKPYDTQADVWLDPARDWLPVRVRLAVPQADEVTEFRLAEAGRP